MHFPVESCLGYCTAKGLAPVIALTPGNDIFALPKGRTIAIASWGGHAGLHIGLRLCLNALRLGFSRIVFSTPSGWTDENLALFTARQALLRIFPFAELRAPYVCLAKARKPFLAPIPGRIALFGASLAGGGAERQMVATACGLSRRGHTDIHVLCSHIKKRPGHDFFLESLQKEGVATREIPRPTSPASKGETPDDENLSLIDAHFGRLLRRLPPELAYDIVGHALEIMRIRPEIVHAWQDSPSMAAGFAAAILGVPHIILGGRTLAPPSYPNPCPWLRAAYQALSRNPSVSMINNSTAGARDYENWLGFRKGRIRVLFNGFDESSFQPPPAAAIDAFRKKLGIPAGHRVIGTAARMSEEKDPLLFCKTAKILLARNETFCILHVGDGPLANDVRQKIAEAGMEGRYFMPGQMTDIPLALSAMDVFLLTSRIEGTPNAIIEAGAMGIPVVATDAGGTVDTLADGKTGFLLRSRDAAAIAERTEFILTHPEWAREASKKSPAFVKGRFGMERMISETLGVYGMEAS